MQIAETKKEIQISFVFQNLTFTFEDRALNFILEIFLFNVL